MLDYIITSKIRKDILKLFVLRKQNNLHMREIQRLVDGEIYAVRRELLNLVEAKILSSKKDGQKIIFTLVKDNLNIINLYNIFFCETSIISPLIENYSQFGTLQTLIITDVLLNMKDNINNEVEIILIGELDMDKLNKYIDIIKKDFNRDLVIYCMSRKEYAQKLHSKDKDLWDALTNNHLFINIP